ncbi:MAG: nuclear transport factor 2 family protein [Pseudomonadota bacterium]
MHDKLPEDHPNLALLKRINLHDIASSKEAFRDDVVFHYFNPSLPEMQGDYLGLDGLRAFFNKIGAATKGTFKVNPVSASAIGDELVVTHTRNSLTLDGRSLETDVVVVWRIVEGRIAEVWDIPSAFDGVSVGQ